MGKRDIRNMTTDEVNKIITDIKSHPELSKYSQDLHKVDDTNVKDTREGLEAMRKSILERENTVERENTGGKKRRKTRRLSKRKRRGKKTRRW